MVWLLWREHPFQACSGEMRFHLSMDNRQRGCPTDAWDTQGICQLSNQRRMDESQKETGVASCGWMIIGNTFRIMRRKYRYTTNTSRSSSGHSGTRNDVEMASSAIMTVLLFNDYINFTMQSMHMGLPLSSSMKTLAGCMSSKAKRSEI